MQETMRVLNMLHFDSWKQRLGTEMAVDGGWWNEMQDSYFVVEDMGVTFGVRLGGVDRVALYGPVLRCILVLRHAALHTIGLQVKTTWYELQRSGRWPWGVWRTLRCFHPCGTEQLQQGKQTDFAERSLNITAEGRHLPTQLAQSRHFAEGPLLTIWISMLGCAVVEFVYTKSSSFAPSAKLLAFFIPSCKG